MGHGDKSSKRYLVAAMVVASVIASFSGQRLALPLRSAAQTVLAPLGDAVMYVATTGRRKVDQVGLRSVSPDEAKRLRDENDLLRARNEYLACERRDLLRQIAEIQHLRSRLYGPSHDFPCDLLRARVIATDALPYGMTRTVNVGSSVGVRAGSCVTTRGLITDRSKELPANLAVMSTEALVGKVVAAGPFTARAVLVSDKAFEILALIWRDPSRPRQILVRSDLARKEPLTESNNAPVGPVRARGDGKGGLTVTDVIASHEVLEGDWLMTRQDDEFLPTGVLIGRVERVQDDQANPGMKILDVRPYADLSSLRDVYVVLPLSVPPAGGGG